MKQDNNELQALENAVNNLNLKGHKVYPAQGYKAKYFLRDNEGNTITGSWDYTRLNHFIMGYGKAFNKFTAEHPEQPAKEQSPLEEYIEFEKGMTEKLKEESSNREEGDILEGISKGEWKIGGTSRGLNNYYIEAGGEKIAQIFSSIPNCEKNADIISKAPELAKENQELRESNTRLKEALQGILNNWDERMSGDKEVWKDGKDSVSGFGYYSPSSSMVSSEFISKAREALNNNNPK